MSEAKTMPVSVKAVRAARVMAKSVMCRFDLLPNSPTYETDSEFAQEMITKIHESINAIEPTHAVGRLDDLKEFAESMRGSKFHKANTFMSEFVDPGSVKFQVRLEVRHQLGHILGQIAMTDVLKDTFAKVADEATVTKAGNAIGLLKDFARAAAGIAVTEYEFAGQKAYAPPEAIAHLALVAIYATKAPQPK